MILRRLPVTRTTLLVIGLLLVIPPAYADSVLPVSGGPYPYGPPYGPHGPHFAPRHRPPPAVVVIEPAPPVVVVQPAPDAAVPAPAAAAQPHCREYQTQAIVGGQVQPSYGTACQQPDGSWKIVSRKP